jgi:hypothetical protein
VEQEPLGVRRERDVVLRPLHPLLEPRTQLAVVEVRQLDAERPAVGLAQAVDQLAQRARPLPARVVRDRQIEVGPGDPVILEGDAPGPAALHGERVEVRVQVTLLAVGLHQPVHPELERLRP